MIQTKKEKKKPSFLIYVVVQLGSLNLVSKFNRNPNSRGSKPFSNGGL